MIEKVTSTNGTAQRKASRGKLLRTEEVHSVISSVSAETVRLIDELEESMPQVSHFLRDNLKPIVAIATLGLTAYGIFKEQYSISAPKRGGGRFKVLSSH